MNTYSENFQSDVQTTLGGLDTQQDKLNSTQISAEYDLYFAQGAQLTAMDKLDKVVQQYDFAQLVDDQGVENDNKAINLLMSATEAQTNVATTVTNMATAASDIQIAANAVLLLTNDIGGALNIATAADFGGDIFRMTRDTNSVMQTTAYQAELTSQMAMEASTSAAEIIATDVKTQATAAKTGVESLLKVTTNEFTKLTKTRSADNAKVATTSKKERAAEGMLADANKEASAIKAAYKTSNEQLNYGLKVTKNNKPTSIFVDFTPYTQAFGPIPAAGSTPVAGEIKIPNSSPTYYLTLVKNSSKSIFNLHAASANSCDYLDKRFIEVTPNSGKVPHDVSGLSDSDGDAIKPGVAYVAFLYIELELNYKKYLANFDDVLSAPSQSFTLTTNLGAANGITAKPDGKVDVTSVIFYAFSDLSSGIEYRCMFLSGDTPTLNRFVTDGPKETVEDPTDPTLGFYFNESIAEQVSAANYSVGVSIGSSVTNGTIKGNYSVKVDDTTTDNFGNEIIPGMAYFPVVLTIVDESSGVDSAKYQSVLSSLSIEPIVLRPVDPARPLAKGKNSK